MSTFDHRSPTDEWQATRAQTALATQILRDENDYLESGKPDIGRQTAPNERELFVSCEPALALQQQFEHLQPEFIAVHDIATTSSRKLLAGIAAATGRAMQKLVIRRQGYGTALATLEYVELPTSEGALLRMFTTEADADSASRHGLARVLLGFSRLGVVMAGDLPAHALAAAFKPLHDDIRTGPWPNRNLLLLPLASASTIAMQGSELAAGTGVNVRTTPQVSRPADAWGFISSTWSRLRDPLSQPAVERPVPPQRVVPAPIRPASPPARPRPDWPGSDETQPMVLALRPMPEIASTRARGAEPAAAPSALDRYVRRLSELAGMVSCCVFDVAGAKAVAHAGASPGPNDLARHGTELLASMSASSRTLGMGHALPDAAITLGAHHLLLRAVPKHPGLALHAVLDKTTANLTLARLQVQRLDALFDEKD